MKKFLIVLLVIAAVIFIAFQGIKAKFTASYKNMEKEYTMIQEPNLDKVPDGVYPGKYAGFPDSVELNVTVKAHRITRIDILKQMSGKGYDAKELPDRIVKSQKIRLDAITGATISSKTIMLAVSRAFKEPNK